MEQSILWEAVLIVIAAFVGAITSGLIKTTIQIKTLF
jgi:hypothetical protein